MNAFPVQVHNGQTHYGNIHGSPVFWNGPDTARVYAWGENSPLKAYKFGQGQLREVNTPRTSAFRPPLGMPGGMLAVSANGRQAGSGIVWGVVPLDGDANQQRGVKGIVVALDAQDVNRTLWTSELVPQRDRLGLFAKFAREGHNGIDNELATAIVLTDRKADAIAVQHECSIDVMSATVDFLEHCGPRLPDSRVANSHDQVARPVDLERAARAVNRTSLSV